MFTCVTSGSLTAGRLAVLTVIQLLVCPTVYSQDVVTTLTIDNSSFTYQISRTNSTWNTSDSLCKGLSTDSHLAILDIREKLLHVSEKYTNVSLWIGGHQNQSDDYWMWLNGITLDQPQGTGSCLAVVDNMTTAIPCTTRSRYYVCGFSASSCPVHGLNLYNTSKECINLFNVNDEISLITWSQAKKNCSLNNGTLATLTDKNITITYNITYIGGERHQRWWWAYNKDSGIRTVSRNVTTRKSRDQCLLLTNGSLIGVNCTERHFVLCEVVTVAPSSEPNLFLIIGITAGLFLLLVVIITLLVIRFRQARKTENAQSNSAQNEQDDVIYLEALTANPSSEPGSTVVQTLHHVTEPSKRPVAMLHPESKVS